MKVREVGMFSNLFPLDPQSNRHQSFCHQSKLPSIWWLTSCCRCCKGFLQNSAQKCLATWGWRIP